MSPIFMSFLVPFIVVISVLSVIFYVFYSIGLYTLAKRRGLRYPGLAFVPAINYWLIGSAADQYDLIYKGRNMKLRHVLLWLSIPFYLLYIIYCVLYFDYMSNIWMSYSFMSFPTALMIVTSIMFPLGIVLTVFHSIALYKLYRSCTPDNATALLVCSIIFSVIVPFVMFSLRNSDKGMPPQEAPSPQSEPSL